MSGVDTVRHLLPRGLAWSGDNDDLIAALGDLSDDAQEWFDDRWGDLLPETTVDLSEWEAQFALPNTGLSEADRRTRLAAAWAVLGVQAQTVAYIQGRLQGAGFSVFLHEAFDNGPPNPLALLTDTGIQAGEDGAQCGETEAQCGNLISATGYHLVNKLTRTVREFTTLCGEDAAACGENTALSGAFIAQSDVLSEPPIPVDANFRPFFLYIGGETFPNTATVPSARRDEFENLTLKLCPAQQWLGILVTYT